MNAYLKYISGFVGILIVGGLVLFGIREYRYRTSPEYQAMKYFNSLADQYAKDTYGGDTPEETLRLFIDALKKGDVELASRYFVVEKQEEKLAELKIGKEKGNLEKLIKLLSQLNYKNQYADGSYEISLLEKGKPIEYGVHFVLNEKTKKWKIERL